MQDLSQGAGEGAFGRVMKKMEKDRKAAPQAPGIQQTIAALTGQPSGGVPKTPPVPADPAVVGEAPDMSWPKPLTEEETGD
jgi:hypothetical protein